MRWRGLAQAPASLLHLVCLWADGDVGEALAGVSAGPRALLARMRRNGKRNAFNFYGNLGSWRSMRPDRVAAWPSRRYAKRANTMIIDYKLAMMPPTCYMDARGSYSKMRSSN